MLKISEVKVTKVTGKGKLLAYANVTFDSSFVVSGFKIFDGQDGPFVSNPSYKKEDGIYQDIAFPITKEYRDKLHERILENLED